MDNPSCAGGTATTDQSEMSFAEQVDAVLANNFPRESAVYVGETPEILGQVGLDSSLPMLITAKHIRNACRGKNEKKHTHGIEIDQMKRLPQLIADPAMLMDSRDKGSNSIVVVTHMVDSDGAPIIVAIKAQGRGMYKNISLVSNYILSIYGKDNFARFIQNNINDDTFLYINKRKSQSLSNRAKVQFFGQLVSYDFDIIIRKTRANVNQQMEEQEKFHQHTTEHNAASKINRPVPAQKPLSFEERVASAGKKAAAVNQRRTAAKELTAAKSEINRRSERG